MDKLSEKEWVAQELTGSPRGWEDLMQTGRAYIDNLEDGKLKNLLLKYGDIISDIDILLEELEYEPG